MSMKTILITGGLGYIGSHIAYDLAKTFEYDIILIDNLSNSSLEILNEFTGFKNNIKFIECDCIDEEKLTKIFKKYNIYAVIHLAGFKSVEESCMNPLKYYQNNLISTITLTNVMQTFNCFKLIFSSSASIYGNPDKLPITENTKLNPISPYAKTKYIQELMLNDLSKSNIKWSIYSLRYFNPIGELSSSFRDKSRTNIMPCIIDVYNENNEFLSIYGNDYNTPDKTAIRDYIHVLDLSNAHIKALKQLNNISGFIPLNLGIGKGTSVLELVNIFNKVNTENKVNYVYKPRRKGDVESIYCSCNKAMTELEWKPIYNVENMVLLN